MAKDRLFDNCFGITLDRGAVGGRIDNEGVPVERHFRSWFVVHWNSDGFALEKGELGIRVELVMQQESCDVVRPSVFRERVGKNVGNDVRAFISEGESWGKKDHLVSRKVKDGELPYYDRQGRRRYHLPFRFFIPKDDSSARLVMRERARVGTIDPQFMEELMGKPYTKKDFAEDGSLLPIEHEGLLYRGVDLGPREDGSTGPFGFIVGNDPDLRPEADRVIVDRMGGFTYLNATEVSAILQVYWWAMWQIPAALVGEEPVKAETPLLPSSTEGGKATGSDGTPSVTSPGGST